MGSKTEARSPAASAVVTANRLLDGRVVWLTAGGGWVEDFAEAAIFAGDTVEAGLAEATEAEKAQLIVAPYSVDVAESTTGPMPVKCRERVRVVGPSVRTDLGRDSSVAPRLTA
jgi:hypothetical protein